MQNKEEKKINEILKYYGFDESEDETILDVANLKKIVEKNKELLDMFESYDKGELSTLSIMSKIKIDENHENEFNYEYLENIVDNNKVVFLYVYNKELEKTLEFIIDKNIEMIQSSYNPNKTLLINANTNIHQKINEIFQKDIVLPAIIVFKDKEMVEFIENSVLIEK